MTKTMMKQNRVVLAVLSLSYFIGAASIIVIYLVMPLMMLLNFVFHDAIIQLLTALLLLTTIEYAVCNILAKTTLQPSNPLIEQSMVKREPLSSLRPSEVPHHSLATVNQMPTFSKDLLVAPRITLPMGSEVPLVAPRMTLPTKQMKQVV